MVNRIQFGILEYFYVSISCCYLGFAFHSHCNANHTCEGEINRHLTGYNSEIYEKKSKKGKKDKKDKKDKKGPTKSIPISHPEFPNPTTSTFLFANSPPFLYLLEKLRKK